MRRCLSPNGGLGLQQLDREFARKLGHLVQAAYAMWNTAQGMPYPRSLTPPPPNPMPEGYQMQAWVQMADFAFGSQEKRFYGFIAVDGDGRGALVIRGTEGLIEWYDDAVAWLTPFRQVPGAYRRASRCPRRSRSQPRCCSLYFLIKCPPPRQSACPIDRVHIRVTPCR